VSDGAASGAQNRPWSRHELLRVAPAFWTRVLAGRLDLKALPLLAGWADRGWPAIVRRRMANESVDSVPIGVPLPPANGKVRIALSIPETAVLERTPPPSLSTVKHVADPAWRRTIDALVALGARLSFVPASFGSLLWQHQTGLQYLSRQSDLDVLWYPRRDCDIASLVASIAAVERTAPTRIDGEIVLTDDSAVNWRELLTAMNARRSGEVLVKSIGGVRFVNVSQLLNLRRVA
jgi:phosphoribosyl-dephospho-CoA transferase